MPTLRSICTAALSALFGVIFTFAAQAQTHVGNVVIDGSLCVGFDCPAAATFGDSTILMMENNTRIKFGDTSAAASFPNNDWEIEANSSANGGANYLGFNDCGTADNDGGCATDLVFAVEAGAPQSALYVESDGDVGFGTSNPVVDLHAIDGNTPTLRLEQNTSAGFAAQTWDLAGNETNFFIRDVTNGSALPFRIEPGAPSNVIYIDSTSNIGLGTTSPDGPLHIADDSAYITLGDTNDNDKWFITHAAGNNGNLEFTNELDASGSFTLTMVMTPTGDMTIAGGLITGTAGSCTAGTPCDAVFDPSLYEVPSIEEHAAFMWENQYLPAVGPTRAGDPVNVTEKMLTMLNELEHAHIYIEELNVALKQQSAEIDALKAQIVLR